MENIWQWGLGVVYAAQKIRSPFSDAFFSGVSFFGTIAFYIIFLPAFYWCFNKKHAIRLLVLFFISSWLNSVMKDILNHPRPYNLDPSVKIGSTGGPGLPSGHAQLSLAVWGYLSGWVREPVFTFFSAVFILLIAFSRVYLGVHFPTDIFGGWLLAALGLLIVFFCADWIEKLFLKLNKVILSAGCILIPALFSAFYASTSSVMSMGAMSGFSIGVLIEARYIGFSEPENFIKGVLRYIAGLAVLLIIYSAGKLLPDKKSLSGMAFLFIHSWIMGLWISAAAPLFFKKFRF